MSGIRRSKRLFALATAVALPVMIGAVPAPAATWFAPNSGNGDATSRNWAGYAATGGSFTAVSGSWTVPTVTPSGGLSSDAVWVGVGGVTSQDLIQVGTQDLVQGDQVSRQAWIEMLPDASQAVLPVNAGDSINASVVQQSAGAWQLTITDTTTQKSYQTSVAYQSSLSSADWIVEAPTDGRQEVTLDNFGNVAFTNGLTTDNGSAQQSIGGVNAQTITMVTADGTAIAVPSSLASTSGSSGSSFSVARTGPAATGAPEPRPGYERVPGGPIPFPIVPRRGFRWDPAPWGW
ncbi:MAG: hypothetical protein JO057_10665 [Chloroflexi bacterium]|nr:hypothetical protein [Chloroflexota bacterium]